MSERSYLGRGEGLTAPPLPWGYFDYDRWPSREPSDWAPSTRGERPDDQFDFHVDLGCGRLPKGRIGVDRYAASGVNIITNLDSLETYWVGTDDMAPPTEDPYLQPPTLCLGLPFEDSSIESMVTHHCLEHVGPGFIKLMDECYRVLKPGAPFRIIVPLFPSTAAVEDPDHKRYFMLHSFDPFCGDPGPDDDAQKCWMASFSVPYTRARFKLTDKDYTSMEDGAPDGNPWAEECARELRVTLRASK